MKKIASFFLCIVLILSFSVSAFAADAGGLICPTCGSAVLVHSDTIEGIYHNIEYVCSNKDCDYKRKEKKILGMESVSGATATPIEGVTAPPAGYVGKGVPNYTSSGNLIMYVEPYALGVIDYDTYVYPSSKTYRVGFGSVNSFTLYSLGSSGSGEQYFNDHWIGAIYKFTAPVTGIYYIGSEIGKYEFATLSWFPRSGTYALISLHSKRGACQEWSAAEREKIYKVTSPQTGEFVKFFSALDKVHFSCHMGCRQFLVMVHLASLPLRRDGHKPKK